MQLAYAEIVFCYVMQFHWRWSDEIMSREETKAVRYAKLFLCFVLVSVLALGVLGILQQPSPPPVSGEVFADVMLQRLSQCASAQGALQRLERGYDRDMGSYRVSKSRPSSIRGILLRVVIDAPSGASPQYSLHFVYPAPRQLDMCSWRKEANGSIQRKAFAERYVDWNAYD